jgi:hypothetical protein
MLGFKCAVFLSVLILAFFVFSVSLDVSASGEADARSAVVAAEGRVADCYGAVSEAAKAGANVTGLLVTLNEAGELLSKADLAYNAGNFDSARDFALQSQLILNGFVEEATSLRENTLHESYWDFMINVVGSLVGTSAVIFGGFFVWRSLKKNMGRLEEGFEESR